MFIKNYGIVVYLKLSATFFIFSFFLFGCKEVGPNINLSKGSKALADTTYIESPVQVAEMKRVLMEEFTGVQCVNCPAGHVIIETLKNNFGEQLVAVGYHTDFLGQPYAFSTEDFRTTQATEVQNYLVFDGYKPAAAIDRVAFDGNQTSLLYPRNSWNNRVQQQLTKTAPLNIELSNTYDAATKKLTIAVELHYTQNVADAQKITLLLTESGMQQPQLNIGNVIDTIYTHKDVERVFLTNVLGDELNTTTEAGRVVRRIYETTLGANWKPENIHAVAFVHLFGTKREVLQAKEIVIK